MKANLAYQEFLNHWSKQKFNGKSFDDIFQIDGVPLWWFYRKFFLSHMMPKQVNLLKNLEENKELSLFDKIESGVSSFVLREYINFSELNKRRYLKKNKKTEGNNKNSNSNVLLLSFSNHLSQEGEVFRLERLRETLKKENLNPFMLFVDPLSRRDHKKIKDLNNLYSYFEKEIDSQAKILAKKINYKWKKLDKKNKEKIFLFKDKNLYPYLEPGLNLFFSKEFLYLLILYYKLFQKIIKTEKIEAVVITGAYSLFEKCLIAAAKLTNIPLIRVDHGLLNNNEFRRHSDLIGNSIEAVTSDSTKEKMIELGVEEKRIIVVGAVNYDHIYQHIQPIKKSKENNILFITTPFVETLKLSKEEYFSKIKRIIKQINLTPNTKITIKLHPLEKHLEEYKKISDKIQVYPGNLARNKYYKLIQDCNVFINFGSNAFLEAMIMDRPIITISLLKEEHTEWLEEKTIFVEKIHDLTEALKEALQNKEHYKKIRKEIVQEYCGKVDGQASDRVAKLISQQILPEKRIIDLP